MALNIDELNIQIEADSKKATSAIDELANGLDRLKTALSGMTVTTSATSNGLKKVEKETKKASNATNELANKTGKATKSFSGFFEKLSQKISVSRTIVSVFQNIAHTMADWFNESNSYQETLNLFNVTMGEGAKEAMNYANKVSELVGIDPAEWMNYQGTFKQLISGFGVASDKANVMSKNLTQLSYDLASFYNTSVETAFDKLSSAMAGQVKGLREFGIDTTVASLQEYALAKGIDKSVSSMTQAEKSLLRYNYILERSVNVQGDMARTLVTPANAMRVLAAQMTQMKRALGNIVSVIVTKFIPYVQVMVKWITQAATAIAAFFGYELEAIDYSSLGEGFAAGFSDAEDSVDGTSDKLKKLKKQLMGFDELNIISNPDSSSGSGSSGSGSTLNMEALEYTNFLEGLELSNEETEKIKNNLKIIAGIAITIGATIGLWGLAKGAASIADIISKLGLGKSKGGTSADVGNATKTFTGLVEKLKGLAKAFAWGLVIILEVCAAALIITGTIWLLGTMLEQVGLAWQPVIDNGETITTAMLIGTALLVGIGLVVYGLGKIGKQLAIDMGIGTLVLLEIGVASALFIAEIWAMGTMLEQVGLAWEPVVANGDTIATAIGIGTGILVAIGVVTGLLGVATAGTAGALPLAIGLGTAILLELGVATGLFITEIWAIGVGLGEILLAWEPILSQGDVIESAIAKGTELLIAIGVVTAALGVASVASVGLLPLAIALGTALLVELGDATIDFTESLSDVADSMNDELAPSLRRLNDKLPKLITDMEDFTAFMSDFAELTVKYTKNSAIAGMASTVDTIISFFTTDPIKKMANDVKKTYNQTQDLNARLEPATEELEIANNLMTEYTDLLSELERLTGKGNATSLADGMFINLKEVGQKLVTGLVDGINNKYNTFKNTVDKLLNNTFSKSTAESYGNSFGKNLGSSMASAIKNTKFPTLKGTVNTSTSGTATINFKAYAEGGFPDMGQMFIARERGPELVGTIGNKNAVANNDQIVSGIEAGVYRAMRAANSGNNGGNTTIRIINEIDGDVVGEKVIKYHNGVVRRTGESPLLV